VKLLPMNATARTVSVEDSARGTLWIWHCPGCQMPHSCDKRWTFNGDTEKPTFRASVLVAWDYGDPPEKRRCHSFVTDGRIAFLADCTHALAGQTVDLPPWKTALEPEP
jgi:Family of unknown function (DUF6527)